MQRDAWGMAMVSIGKPWGNHEKMVISPRKMGIPWDLYFKTW
jgi:hypothetical protein